MHICDKKSNIVYILVNILASSLLLFTLNIIIKEKAIVYIIYGIAIGVLTIFLLNLITKISKK